MSKSSHAQAFAPQNIKRVAMSLKRSLYFISLMAMGSAVQAAGVYCTTEDQTIYPYLFSFRFDSQENHEGYVTEWKEQTVSGRYKVGGGCDVRATTFWSAREAPGLIFAGTDADGTSWFDIPGNDYLQVSSEIAIYNANNGRSPFYGVPFTDISNNCEMRCGNSPAASGSHAKLRLRIKRRFVGASFIVTQPIASLYATQGGTGLGVGGMPMVTLNLNAVMVVPQSCTLNAGDTITFNFGSFGTQAFAGTGKGNKPQGAEVKVNSVDVNCKNIDAESMLSMRIEAGDTDDNIILSNNKDVGFIVADENEKPLNPNNINSYIPFKLQSNNNPSAKIKIKAWPVSATGIKPQAGPVQAKGYLRVDFK